MNEFKNPCNPCNPCQKTLVFECAELALDGEAALAFLDVAYYLGIDVEALADGDYLLGYLWANVDLHAMAHVEYLVHLLPVGA